MLNIKLLVIGFIIGVGSIAPGVSGGSMAIAFGVYERIIGVVVHFKKRIKNEIAFLMPLAVGGIVGIGLFTFGLNILFDRYEFIMRMAFAGLMLGTFPSVYSSACKEGYRWFYPLLFIGIMLLSLFGFGALRGETVTEITPLLAAVSGVIIGIGTVVPGVSASATLMAVGLYKPMLEGFSELDFAIILPTVLGIAISILALLKTVEWLFSRFYGEASFVFFGLLGGSTAAIVPEITAFDGRFFISIAVFISGALLAFLFGKRFAEQKKSAR